MIYRVLCVQMMLAVLPTLVFGSASKAQEQFKLLGEKEIQTKVIGNDITDYGSKEDRYLENREKQTLYVESKHQPARLP